MNLETRKLGHTELKKYLNKRHDDWVIMQITSRSKYEDKLPVFKEKFEEFFKYAHLQCKSAECKNYVQDSMGIIDKLPVLVIFPFGRKSVNTFVRIEADFSAERIAEILINYVHPAEQILN